MNKAASFAAEVIVDVLWKHAQRTRRTIRNVRHSETIQVRMPLRDVRPKIKEYLAVRGFRLHNNGWGVYRRGDRRIRRLPWTHEVDWEQTPLLLQVRYRSVRGSACVTLCISSWPSTQLSESAAQQFRTHAAAEIRGAVAFLTGNAQTPRSERVPQSPPQNNVLDDDLKLLGLTRGFSWEQLQSAYRSACRTYHPDRLSGIDPHLVQLAEERFKQIAAAYQRLRERTPQSRAS